MAMVLVDPNYVLNTIAPKDRLDIDGTNASIEKSNENLECMEFRCQTALLSRSFLDTAKSVGYTGMSYAAAVVVVVEAYKVESGMWEKAQNFANVYMCEVAIIKFYCNMAEFEAEDGSKHVFDVSYHLCKHLERASACAHKHGIVTDEKPPEFYCSGILRTIRNLKVLKLPMLEVPIP
jgi:hypothetical protein